MAIRGHVVAQPDPDLLKCGDIVVLLLCYGAIAALPSPLSGLLVVASFEWLVTLCKAHSSHSLDFDCQALCSGRVVRVASVTVRSKYEHESSSALVPFRRVKKELKTYWSSIALWTNA